MLGVRGSNFLVFYSWQSGDVIKKIDVTATVYFILILLYRMYIGMKMLLWLLLLRMIVILYFLLKRMKMVMILNYYMKLVTLLSVAIGIMLVLFIIRLKD